jgi:pimeloyl-ACP methyl ester carboxylesterase
MGALTVLQLALDRPDLMRVGVAMGCAASGSEGWLGYYMQAEVDYRRAGGSLSGRMSTLHYASMLYPAQVLGDPELFPIVEEMLGGEFEEDNEVSLIGQWQACIDFDVSDRLPECTAPLHIFAFEQDVQAPPQFGRRVAEITPTATLHEFAGMGHCSIYGHRHDTLNAEIRAIVEAP